MLRRYVSLFLACIMIVLSVPVPAFAEVSAEDGSGGEYAEALDITATDKDVSETEELVLKGLKVEPKTLELEVGESENLETIASPSEASPFIDWSTSDAAVATVDQFGTVTAVKTGSAKIKAVAGQYSSICKVTVTDNELINDDEFINNEGVIINEEVTGINLDRSTAEVLAGEAVRLTATVLPEEAENNNVIWSSSDQEIATVTDGVIAGIKAGKATITASTEEGGFSKTCLVTVTEITDDMAVIEFSSSKDKLVNLLKAAGFDSADIGAAGRLKHIYIKAKDSLTAKIELASSDMTEIRKYKNLETFIMEEGLVGFKDNTLPNGSFQTMKRLEKVNLPDVKIIGARSFGHVKGTAGSLEENACTSLKTAEFGEVRSIGCGAFYGCSSLESITFNNISTPPILEDDADHPEEYAYWFDLVPDSMTIYVPDRAIETFLGDEEIGETTEWDRFNIESNGDDSEASKEEAGIEKVKITDLGGKRLSANSAITSSYGSGKKPYSAIGYLTIEAGDLIASDFSFIKNNLTGLQELRIIGTTTLPDATFDDYSQVPDMEADNAAQLAKDNAKKYSNVIPSNAFGSMQFLRFVEITNAQVVGKQAFQKAENLEEVYLPNVVRVNSMAFAMVKGSDQSRLHTISLPSLEYMEHRTFYFNVNLRDLELGSKAPFVYRPQGKEGLWFSFVPGPVTIHVPDRVAYDDFMLEDHCALIDWSSFDFEANNGDELPKVEKAPPYVDSDLDYLREKWQSEEAYFTGDIDVSLNFYTFNVNLNSWRDGKTSPPPLSTLDTMRWAKKVGFDAVDITAYYIPGYSNTAMPTEEQKAGILDFAHQIRDLSEELELPLSGTGIQNNFADPSQKRRELDVERVKYWLDIADEMGAPCLRVFSGTPSADVSRNGWYKVVDERIIPALQEVADYAAEYHPDVMIGLQNHGDMLATANQVLYVLDKVDRDNVRIVNDTGYYHDFMDLNTSSIESYDWYSDIAQILPYTTNFQLKKKPAGAGTGPLIDMERIFTDIRKSSYRGYVPIELLWVPSEPGYPNYLSTPPYEETVEFLAKVREAIEATKNAPPGCDILQVYVPTNAVIHEPERKITATLDKTVTEIVPYIQVSKGAQWKLYGDAACSQEIAALELNQEINYAYIQVTAQNGEQKIYQLEIRISSEGTTDPEKMKVTGVQIEADRDFLYYNTSDNSLAVRAVVEPADAKDYTVLWETSDTTVAEVIGMGTGAKVTGKKAGHVTIKAIVINKDGSMVKGNMDLNIRKYSSSSGGSSNGGPRPGVNGQTTGINGPTVSGSGEAGIWNKDSRGWWFKRSDGSWPASQWLMNNGKWYFFGADGYMTEGWASYQGKWYYLHQGGAMAENTWLYVQEQWYYIGADGALLTNATTPDGYQVDGNGVWVRKDER
jgi:uncharacterized protein YjdB/sugar phosphate isomerase/epimerase